MATEALGVVALKIEFGHVAILAPLPAPVIFKSTDFRSPRWKSLEVSGHSPLDCRVTDVESGVDRPATICDSEELELRIR